MEENDNLQLDETPVDTVFSDQDTDQPQQEIPQEQIQEIIIGEQLTEDDRNKVYERLGRPKDADGYDLNGIVPETYNQGLIEEFKKKAHETGMSQEGVRKMAEWYKEVETKQLEAMNKAKDIQADQYMLELKTEFGANFDKEVNNARKALDAYTDKAFRQYMDESGLGNHPALVKAFAKIGRELSEDRLVQSETASRLAADERLREAERSRLWSDKEFVKKYRSGDINAVRRMNQLYGLG